MSTLPRVITPAQYHEAMKSVKAQGRRRHEPGRMNKTEAAYDEHLTQEKWAGLIIDFWFESVKLRLADQTFYTADFFVHHSNGLLEVHEVKGRKKATATTPETAFVEDDAAVKIKVAAEQYPLFTFFLVFRSASGAWVRREV
jgi:hypothetical protein